MKAPFWILALVLISHESRAVECDQSGYAKTTAACGSRTDVCVARLVPVLIKCQHKLNDEKDGLDAECRGDARCVADVQDRIDALMGFASANPDVRDASLAKYLQHAGKADPALQQLGLEAGSPTSANHSDEAGTTSRPAAGGRGTNGTGTPAPSEESLVTKALAALAAGNAAAAEKELDQALARNPHDAAALSLRAEAREAQGNRDGALADARQAVALNPGDGQSRALLSGLEGAAQAGRKVGGAKLDFGPPRGVQEGGSAGGVVPVSMKGGIVVPGTSMTLPVPGAVPPDLLTLFRQARDKLAAGDDDGALLALHEALDLDPKRVDAWETIADILNKEGDYEGAIAAADKALAIVPSDARALRAKSYAEFNRGDFRAALADAERAIALDATNGLGYLDRAMAEEKLGDKAAAIRDYKTAERLDPALMPAAEAGLARLGGSAPDGAAGAPRSLPLKLGVVGGSGILLLLGLLGTASGRRVVQDYTRRLKTIVGPKPVEEARVPMAVAESETVALGALIGGHYRITGELGRGGMGAVYKAHDETLQRPVAVKRLIRESRGSRDDLERLLKEARLVAQLRHPNIAEIYSVITDRDPMLVFEFVDGESLDKTLRRNAKLSPSRAREIVAQVCSALEYAHGRHIIHRDLKPANVMFAADRSVKVMDFGIAHQSTGGGADTRTMTAAGTPQYMAPEQGMGSVSKASDLYALGVMTYELLTGSRPFGGPDFLEPKLRKEFLAATKVNPSLPAAVDQFFDRALEADPLKRPASAAEFRRAFDAALDGVTTEA